MQELFKIILTASFTLIGGVVLLVIIQILTRLIVDPFLDFRRLLGHPPLPQPQPRRENNIFTTGICD